MTCVLSFSGAKVVRFQAPRSPGKFSGRPFDVWGLKRVLPDRWSEFLRAHFTGHVHVAYAFSVDDRTARNWWDGIGAPRAEYALLAVQNFPDAAKMLGIAA